MSYYIYKICCDDCPEFVYVGSTKAFRERKRRHRRNLLNSRPEKLYNTIRDNGGWDNWRMVIIEDCGEITLTEARIKEEEHRVKLNANLNSIKCFRTEEQKEETKKNAQTKYYLNTPNPKINCECGGKYTFHHKETHFKTKKHLKYINEN